MSNITEVDPVYNAHHYLFIKINLSYLIGRIVKSNISNSINIMAYMMNCINRKTRREDRINLEIITYLELLEVDTLLDTLVLTDVETLVDTLELTEVDVEVLVLALE